MAGQAVKFITLVDSSHFCTLQLQKKHLHREKGGALSNN